MKAWVCVAMVALLSEAPGARAAPDTESPDADLRDSATRFVDLLAAGDFATAVKSFDDAMKQALPPDRLAGVWHGILAQAGESVNGVEKARPRSDGSIIRLVQRFTTLARGSANQRGDTFLET